MFIPTKSWALDRRTFLRGVGASLALPALDCMAASGKPAVEPRRLGVIYFPFGVAIAPKDNPESEWDWFPRGEGREYQPTQELITDLTGDGAHDVVMIVHDRILMYPQ